MRKTEELWKDLPLNFDFENEYQIQVSNFGKVKTFNSKHPKGKIIKGTLQGGFPMVRVKLFKKRRKFEIEKISKINNKINAFNLDLKELKSSAKARKEIQKERDQLVKERSAYIKKVDLRRTINFGFLVHKAVAELFLEKPTKRNMKFVIHKDFDKENNYFENLAWASQEDLNKRSNMHPKVILHTFRRQFEERKPNTKMGKLKDNDVLYIKKRLKRGDTLRKLAEKFEVSDMQIHRIKTGENWSHVKLIEDIVEENNK